MVKSFCVKRRKFNGVCYIAADLKLQFTLGNCPFSIRETFVLDTGSPLTIVRKKTLQEGRVPIDKLPNSKISLQGYCHSGTLLEIRKPEFPEIGVTLLRVLVDPRRDDMQKPPFSLLGLDFIEHYSFCFDPHVCSFELCPAENE